VRKFFLLLSIPVLMIVLCGFGAAPQDTSKVINVKHTIPQGIVGVRFVCSDEVKTIDLTLDEALDLEQQVYLEGRLKWFFKEFDRDYLYFFTARYIPNPEKFKRPWGTYVTENIYRVKSSQAAEVELGVIEIIEFYEIGKHGIRGGMTKDEVIAILGKPNSIEVLGPLGSFDYLYDDFTVRFLEYKVALIN